MRLTVIMRAARNQSPTAASIVATPKEKIGSAIQNHAGSFRALLAAVDIM